ncbi:MAG: SMI1/KNR4 family protein [Allomuricauda sp.]
MDYSEQIHRIKEKLSEAKEADSSYRVFGAGNHKYKLYPPVSQSSVEVFEKEYRVHLPECYRAFVLNVGNGGISYQDSGAGPFYGIYALGDHLNELVYGDPKAFLVKNFLLSPEMSETTWENLTKTLWDEYISNEDYYTELGKIYGGIMPLGAQGCTYLHGLVLNGPFRGRVLNLDMAAEQKPQFTYESNFLDWYERWLDEIISGKLITISPSWFGYAKPEGI